MIIKVDETGIKVADMEGEIVDNKRRLEALKQLETLIEEEKVEQEKLEKEEEVYCVSYLEQIIRQHNRSMRH